ncbi:hypothetical protein D3C80_2224500 [compost metagenome]
MLAIFGNEALVIPDQSGDLLLLDHERLLKDGQLLLQLIELGLMAAQILVSLLLN